MVATEKLVEGFEKIGKFALDNVKIVTTFFQNNDLGTIHAEINGIRKLINDEANVIVEEIAKAETGGVKVRFSIYLGAISNSSFLIHLSERKYENNCVRLEESVEGDNAIEIETVIEDIVMRPSLSALIVAHLNEKLKGESDE